MPQVREELLKVMGCKLLQLVSGSCIYGCGLKPGIVV